jgi:hypothetical protein
MKYLAVPYYTSNVVKIYSLPDATLVTTIDFTPGDPGGSPGPNCVVLYQDAADAFYLFVSYDFGTSGAVDVYPFSSIDDLIANPPNIGAPTRNDFGSNSVCGMAIHPGTGDLYVATFANGNAGGGVYQLAKSGGYTITSQFASFFSPNENVANYCANLGFDLHGNLWMTTFSDSDPTHQFLICFTQVYPSPDNSQFFKFTNGAQVDAAAIVTLPGSGQSVPGPLYPLSQPEGIAFDPLGNLWLANNNDDFATNGENNGTLVKVTSQWIESVLHNTSLTGDPTVNGFGGTQTMPVDPADAQVYYYSDARFGGLAFDGFTLYANDQNDGWDASNAVVWQCDSRNPASNFAPTGISTTYPGNGTMAPFNATPPSLLIRDYAADIGMAPPPPPPGDVSWESCDIGVSTESGLIASVPLPSGPWSATDTSTPAPQSEGTISIKPGNPAYLYVKVANTGSEDSIGTEVVKLYWAKGSASLDWPQPWDGSVLDGATPLGGFIGAMLLPVIPSQTQTYVTMEWSTVPIPADYSTDVNHFCLLARIETSSLYAFGMRQPEQIGDLTTQTPLKDNVNANSTIAWRNISILTETGQIHRPEPRPILLPILGGNYGSTGKKIGFSVHTLGRGGKPEPIRAKVIVHAEGAALQRMYEAKFDEKHVSYLGEGRFHLVDLEKGLAKIHLHPQETLPFTLEFTPEQEIRDFAVRVIQYLDSEGTAKVVGGQTFVVGNVEGFPVRKK